MFLKILLGWSFVAIVWWVIAWVLVARSRRASTVKESAGRVSLSIFKPLPILGERGLSVEAEGLESFLSQMDDSAEMLLGVHDGDDESVGAFVEAMRRKYPGVRIQMIFRGVGDPGGNPKIAGQRVLAPHATGDLWLWSDADIVVPPDFLQRARVEFSQCGARMLTFPYAVRNVPQSCALLDALFVNVEFLPGVLLLRHFGAVDFGLGAAMLFRRDDFLEQADWQRLGCSLADDFVLGQLLRPVCLSSVVVATATDVSDWKTALVHYLRWMKTIRWCRPAGYAGQIMILPMLGWLACVGLNPTAWWSWTGLIAMMQFDTFFALRMCTQAGCRLTVSDWLTAETWSLGRALAWVICWLPFPVLWRTRAWWRPELELESVS